MTLDHFATCVGTAEYLTRCGVEKVILHHSNGVDIETEIDNKKISFEYERPGTHTQSELFEKKKRAEQEYDRVIFIAQKANLNFVQKACGDENVVLRGVELKELLDELTFTIKNTKIP